MAIARERLTRRKELKFTKSDLATIEHAAILSGDNETVFIRSAALEKAHRILESEKHSLLGSEDWNDFASTVTSYTEPPKELKKNMASFLNRYNGDV